ncbi:MAG: hypothetical protein IPM52_01190 [Bacteroidetes bacterium]|nr:hypothetical protein [Bacteroidota bacterium]
MTASRYVLHTLCALVFLLLLQPEAFSQAASKNISSLKRADFIQLAQGSDTLEAVTNLFFRKRKEAQTGFILAGAAVSVFVLGSVAFAIGAGMSGADDPTEELQVGAAVFSIVFYGLVIGSGFRLIRYSKGRLHDLMKSYPVDGQLPEFVKNQLRNKDFPEGYAVER